MNCVKCGSLIADGNNFCMICGTPVGTQVQPQASAPVAGTAPAPAPVQQQAPLAASQTLPYAPPAMQDGNIIIPFGRKYRIVCPDCHSVSEDLKRDQTPGFPCRSCGKAYAYGGQLLIYRCGMGMPSCGLLHVDIVIDGVVYGEITNTESVRILLSNGTHIIGAVTKPNWPYSPVTGNQFQIVVGPQSNSLAFKMNIIYRYRASNGVELKQCNPEEIPNI